MQWIIYFNQEKYVENKLIILAICFINKLVSITVIVKIGSIKLWCEIDFNSKQYFAIWT